MVYSLQASIAHNRALFSVNKCVHVVLIKCEFRKYCYCDHIFTRYLCSGGHYSLVSKSIKCTGPMKKS